MFPPFSSLKNKYNKKGERVQTLEAASIRTTEFAVEPSQSTAVRRSLLKSKNRTDSNDVPKEQGAQY